MKCRWNFYQPFANEFKLGCQQFVKLGMLLTHSQFLEGFKCESQIKNSRRIKSRGTLPNSQHFRGVKEHVEARDGTKKNWQASLTHMGLHKTNTRWLMHSLNTFGVRTNHGQLRLTRLTTAGTWGTQPPSPYSILCASPWGPHPNDILSLDSQVWVSKLPKLGLPWLWGPIISRVDLVLRWDLKESCSPHQDLSNGMSHVTCTQVNQVDSWLLVVGSEIVNSTPGLSFGHKLGFSCTNGSLQAHFKNLHFNIFPMI